jgi:putative nucleotidyltransferase with HDIG domain
MDDNKRTHAQLIEELAATRQRVCELEKLEVERQHVADRLMKSLAKLRSAMEETVQAMALTVETRDPYTAGHQHRVAKLGQAIAEEMSLPSETVDGTRMAAMVHDVGKLYVPSEFLSKPTQLSDLEFAIIKRHPEVGYNILKGIEFPWPVPQIVLQHHERNDGSGYPHGLHCEDILLEARILAVADVVEAMSSHRPYHPALGLGTAMREVCTHQGVLYDTEVVSACAHMFNEGRLIW